LRIIAPVPASTLVQPRRKEVIVHSANSAFCNRGSNPDCVIVNFDEDPPSRTSRSNSRSQSPTAFGGSTVSASRQITRSASWQYSHHPMFSASDFLWARRGSSWTITLGPSNARATSAVASLQPLGSTTIRSIVRCWATSASIVSPIESCSL
jgi:hypothetical protein